MDDEKALATGSCARAAEVSENLIRLYADEGLLPCTKTASGMRLFRSDAPQRAREIFAARMSRRGRPSN